MPRLDEATVHIGGASISQWNEYRLDSDLLTPADGAVMKISLGGAHDQRTIDERVRVRDLTREGQPVRVSVGDHLQFDGVVDDQEVGANEEEGMFIRLTMRDRAAFLVDSYANLHVQVEAERMVVRRRAITFEPGQFNPYARGPFAVFPVLPAYETVRETVVDEVTIGQLFRAMCEPWGIPVCMEGVSSRDILTGRRAAQPAVEHRRRVARAYGVSEDSVSRRNIRRNEQGEITINDQVGQAPSQRSRSAHANGLAPDDIEKLRPRDARPRAGEKTWDFMSRHAKRFGLMLWMAPDGRLIVASPNYDDRPIGRIVRRFNSRADDPNNVKALVRKRSVGDRFSECTVYGRSPGGDARRSRFRVAEYDVDFPFYKPLVVHDNSIRDVEEAARRARRELNMRGIKADIITAEVAGHGQTYLWATDTMVTVIDEITGVDADYYCIRRQFMKNEQNGTGAILTLIPRGALVL